MFDRAEHRFHDALQPRIALMRQFRRLPLSLLVASSVTNVLLGLLPVAFVIMTSIVIGLVPRTLASDAGSRSAESLSLVGAFVGAGSALLVQQVLTPVSLALGERIKHRVDGQVHRDLMALALRNTSISLLEDQRSLRNLELAAEDLRRGATTPGDAAAGTSALIIRYVKLGGFLAVLGHSFAWWAALLLLILVLCLRRGQKGGMRLVSRLRPALSPLRREAEYLRDLGTSSRGAKELRIFSLTEWFSERFERTWMATLRPLWAARRKYSGKRFIWLAMAAILVVGGTAIAILRAGASRPDSVTYVALALQALVAVVMLGEFYHESDPATEFGMLSSRSVDAFKAQVEALAETEDVGALAAALPDDVPRDRIAFTGLSFAYPGTGERIFDGFDLAINAGECTAILGLNGAGKTTLVKLLARLYEPTAGSIAADAVDIGEVPVSEWRRRIAVVFQDFNRYELSVEDNVRFGSVEHADDGDAVRRALQRAGALEFVAALPSGQKTMLSRQLLSGTELSGGQWQRIAIARALYAVEAGAKVLVLDEPTAALDARSEAVFFAEFMRHARDLTTIVISHRFSTVRQADRIVVLSEGAVIEDGSHDELLRYDGEYARLFRLQAERFVRNDDESGSMGDGS